MKKPRFKLIPAVYLILRKDDEIVLLKRANTGYQDGNYSLIAGHLEGDERASDAIIREAKEEAGISIEPADLRFVHFCHRLNRNEVDQERVDLFYETSSWQGQVANMEPEKCDDLSWFNITTLPDNTIPLIRRVLTDVSGGIMYSEYLTGPID